MNPLFLGLLVAGVVLVARRHPLQLAAGAARASPDRCGVPQAAGARRGRAIASSRCCTAGRRGGIQRAVDRRDADAGDDRCPRMPTAKPGESLPRSPSTRAERLGLAPDPDIECVVILEPQQPVSTAALGVALSARLREAGALAGPAGARTCPGSRSTRHGRTVGRNSPACLLLANRAGSAIPRRTSNAFCDDFAGRCRSCAAAYTLPDDPARSRARGGARSLLRRSRRPDRADHTQERGGPDRRNALARRRRGGGFSAHAAGQFDYARRDGRDAVHAPELQAGTLQGRESARDDHAGRRVRARRSSGGRLRCGCSIRCALPRSA